MLKVKIDKEKSTVINGGKVKGISYEDKDSQFKQVLEYYQDKMVLFSVIFKAFKREAMEIVLLEQQLEERRKAFIEKYYFEEDEPKIDVGLGYLLEYKVSKKALNKMSDTEIHNKLEAQGFDIKKEIWTDNSIRNNTVFKQFKEECK